MSTILILMGLICFVLSLIHMFQSFFRKISQRNGLAILALAVTMIITGTALAPPVETVYAAKSNAKSEKVVKESSTKKNNSKKNHQQKADDKKVPSKREKAEQQEALDGIPTRIKQENDQLAVLNYSGTQTIAVNNNVPTFSDGDLSLANKAWEVYGDLDNLNRASYAEAMLNKSLMPTKKRGDISKVKPTGWHNKKLGKSYLYNRSHLIGYTLSGENDNWKNLITGTAQLNNPEMLRHEMDIKAYLEKNKKNYVRYSVTPVFRGDELLARGVHLMAKSINTDAINFNVYIFNVQEGITLNYSDGTSQANKDIAAQQNEVFEESELEAQQDAQTQQEQQSAPPSAQEYVDVNGNGLIKGSKNGIYHIPGSQYYGRTTSPAAWFKTVEEAEQAGYRSPK
ncbi:DNA/RNA non-specific endonuclease [Candidatus Enterococcus ferrettii]|uniref:DNA-entry nuclease n=1 Tax=Candidatus Enterococcus ferrettii TaxID=2815324 RepID=A0ABV0EP52_9ENTE|nr:DNA/RNA non-specific endonuclease [Enterococcus sp. 665A]MBO1340804.1 DNA/RNA non-specific endonuclease [Enterococcus sp. 665A]